MTTYFYYSQANEANVASEAKWKPPHASTITVAMHHADAVQVYWLP